MQFTTQNPTHIRNFSELAAKYVTPGGPMDFTNDDNNDDDDAKYSPTSPPTLERPITTYFTSKYTPTQLKELVETVFAQHFDLENNGDIDLEEFTNALENLGCNMTKQRLQKLFNVINQNDGDSEEAYIDKENFSDFLLQKFYNQPALQQYQEDLMKTISPKFSSDIIGINIDFDAAHDESEEQAMKRQLGLMVERELTQIENEAAFQE